MKEKDISQRQTDGQPAQEQEKQPGIENKMTPEPVCDNHSYKGNGKLEGENAIITGGDSGIGRSVAIAFAKEGANVSVVYLDEHEDAKEFSTDTPVGRPGQPAELAPAYVYLASDDSSYVSGQMIHVNGGTVVNG